MKRQRSRNRGGGGGGGGGKPQHNVNRAFDSNGPDGVKIRGHAQHVFEKYQQLARDAASSGDRVLAENYLQHAEHYFRVLRAVQPQRPASEIIGRDAFTSGIDIDFEDESQPEAVEGAEAPEGAAAEEGAEGQPQPQGQNGRQEYRSDNRGEYRERRPDYRDDRGYREGRQDRQDGRQEGGRDRFEGRPRDERPRDDRPRDDRGYNRDFNNNRDDRPRRDDRDRGGYRNDRFEGRDRDRDRDRYGERPDRGDRDRERAERNADPLPVVEPEATPLTASERREDSPTLRSEDGGFSPAPAFLQSRPEPEAEAAPEPRRRRTRAPRKDAETAPAEEG